MIEVSDTVKEKANRLFEDGCVRLDPLHSDRALVKGDHEWHSVEAWMGAVRCDCRAWSPRRLCSHSVAAQIAWADKLASGGRLEPSAAGDAANRSAAPVLGGPPNPSTPRTGTP